jgi:hypothetical protein
VVEAGTSKPTHKSKQEIAKNLVETTKAFLQSSRIMLLSYSVFIVTCILIFLLESQDSAVFGLLDESRTNYWGPLTSIFVNFLFNIWRAIC